MRVIRRGIFETNSSSSHSITIRGGTYSPDRIPIDFGVCRIFGGEFGWGYEIRHDAATKASYCATYAQGPARWDGGAMRIAECRSPEQLEMLRSVVAETVGAPVEFVFSPDDYIDHQSDFMEGKVCEEAFGSPSRLKDFIFNRASSLVIDNDNHSPA